MLKSIFEAVIYLTALSLNKHRIRLIIVTVETQHRTSSPSLPAHPLRGSAPGADPTSAHSCTLAAAAAPKAPGFPTLVGSDTRQSLLCPHTTFSSSALPHAAAAGWRDSRPGFSFLYWSFPGSWGPGPARFCKNRSTLSLCLIWKDPLPPPSPYPPCYLGPRKGILLLLGLCSP